nr:insulinase family protein [Asticcacaulis aquaticus]
MTYVLYRSNAPAQGISMRFRIRAGSIDEREGQEGLAHFVEHMAFKGSKAIGEGELVRVLAQNGVDYGSDANAFTHFETTEYVLDLPGWSDKLVQTGLFIFRETASNLTFDTAAIDRERGVIAAEERERATPDSRASQAWDRAAFAGLTYAERWPIGRAEVIARASRDDLLAFYHAYYRPSRATLIVVGKFNFDAMEKKIATVFNDWQPVGPAPAPPPLGTYQNKGLRTFVHAEKGLPEQLSLSWFRPWIDLPDAKATRRVGLLKALAVDIFNHRLSEGARAAGSPWLGAEVGYDNERLTANQTTVTVVPKFGQSPEALSDIVRRINQFRTHGITESELAEALIRFEAANERDLLGRKTPNNVDLASGLLDYVDHDDVYMSPQQFIDLWKELKPAFTVAGVNAQIAYLFSGDGPLIGRQGSERGSFDEAALRAAFEAADGQAVIAVTDAQAASWPYTDFGKPVRHLSKTAIRPLGYSRYTYPNGTVLNFKASALEKNRVVVSVRFEGGTRLFSPDGPDPLYRAWIYDPLSWGLGKLSADGIARALSGKAYGLGYDLDEEAAFLSGDTDKAGFPYQMQLMMAWLTDPGDRVDAFENTRGNLTYLEKGLRATPDAVLGSFVLPMLSCGDHRYDLPDAGEVRDLKPADVTGMVRRTVNNVPIEVTVVGDLSESAALAMMERTFATLPPVPGAPVFAPGGERLSLPQTAHSYRLFHEGRADQAIAFVVFPTTDAVSDLRETRRLELLSAILGDRLNEEVRERQGATYGASAGHYGSMVFRGYGYISAQAEINPDKDDLFVRILMDTARDLRERPVGYAELEKIRVPMTERLNDNFKTHGEWLRVLPGLYGSPRWDYEVGVAKQYYAITPAELQATAQKYLTPERMQRFSILPEKDGQTEPPVPVCLKE